MRFLMKLAGAFVILLLVLSVGSICAAVFIPSVWNSSGSELHREMHYPIEMQAPLPVAYSPSWATVGLTFLAGFGILLVGLVFGLVAAMRFLAGGQRKLRRDPEQLNETLMIQEIHTGLNRMEERIEALETILFDRAAPSPSGHARPKAGRSI